jgi:outer membrane lipoprotein LolB
VKVALATVPPGAGPLAAGSCLAGRQMWAVCVLCAFSLILSLVGCAGLERKPGGVQGRPDPDGFVLEGRIGVRQDGDGYSGSILWRHSAERDVIELFTPVGTLHARLSRDADGAMIEMADGRRQREPDAASLSRRVIGWELPLAELPYWLFTRPAPIDGSAKLESDAAGRPTRLTQAGWAVLYRAYFQHASDPLPSRLDLERKGLKVRLVVSRWSEAR